MINFLGRPRGVSALAAASSIAIIAAISPAQAQEQQRTFNIPAQPLSSALIEFSRQSDVMVVADPAAVNGKRAPAVQGTFTPSDALNHLLAGSGLTVNQRPDGGFVLADTSSPIRLGDATQPPPSNEADAGTAEILVTGRRTLNADIRRTEDDIQPYVTFDRDQIERSQATDVESFLMAQLPMNTAHTILSEQTQTPSTAAGAINLRGLGPSQTLILVDGRRLPASATSENGGDLLQPSITGIPLSSIERIEVLPATAGGIYGGGATGGVINIIRKRDYHGVEAQVTYGNTSRSDDASFDFNLSGGANFNAGRTSVTFSADHSESEGLVANTRNFGRLSAERLFANNPSEILSSGAPPQGDSANICAADIFSDPSGDIGICNGGPLTLDNGTNLGGASFTSAPMHYAGPAADQGAALAQNAGHYNFATQRDGTYLLRSPTINSESLSLRQELTDWFEAYFDVSRSRTQFDLSSGNTTFFSATLHADDPNNPFQQDVLVTNTAPGQLDPGHSDSETLQATIGTIVRLPNHWSAGLEYNWGRTRYSFAQTSGRRIQAAGDAILQAHVFQDLNAFPVDVSAYINPLPDTFGGPYNSILSSGAIRFSGPAFELPAGGVQLTGLIERRYENVPDGVQEQRLTDPPSDTFTLQPHRSQTVNSYYLEAQIPLIAPAQNVALVQELDLEASVRHDRYRTLSTGDRPSASTDGPFPSAHYFTNEVSSTDYTLGLRYRPVSDFTIRASYGTGFLPPALSQLIPTSRIVTSTSSNPLTNPPDPLRGGTRLSTPRTQIKGGNPSLNPEQSQSWSTGMIFAPSFLEGFRLSIDYSQIHKTNEVYGPSLADIIGNEAAYPGRIVRGPNLPSDLPGWAGPVTFIDASLINLSSSLVRSIDVQADYEWQTDSLGTFHVAAIATRMLELQRQFLDSSAPFELVGYFDGPLRWRAQAAFTWDIGPLTAGWNAQYYDSYSVNYGLPSRAFLNADRIADQGSATVPSQTYHDLFLRYHFGPGETPFANADITFGIQNVFDTSPPIISAEVMSDTYSTYGDPKTPPFYSVTSRVLLKGCKNMMPNVSLLQHVWITILVLCLAASGSSSAVGSEGATQNGSRVWTVETSISIRDFPFRRVDFSPDRAYFAFVTRHGETISDSNIYELSVFRTRDVQDWLSRPARGAPSPFRHIERRSSSSVNREYGISAVRWDADGQSLTFLGETAVGEQVFRLRMRSGALTQVTHHSQSVTWYDARGEIVFFGDHTNLVAPNLNYPMQPLVRTRDIPDIRARVERDETTSPGLLNSVYPGGLMYTYGRFTTNVAVESQEQVLLAADILPDFTSVSPDLSHAVMVAADDQFHLIDLNSRRQISLMSDFRAGSTNSIRYANTSIEIPRSQALWNVDGSHVLLVSAYLPSELAAGLMAADPSRMHLVDFDLGTGHWRDVGAMAVANSIVSGVGWLNTNQLLIIHNINGATGPGTVIEFGRDGVTQHDVGAAIQLPLQDSRAQRGGLTADIRETKDDAPMVVISDGLHSATLTSADPALIGVSVVRPSSVHWVEGAGQVVSGALYLPPGFLPPLPLVVQLYDDFDGDHTHERSFSADLAGTSDAAQLLATHGVAVLKYTMPRSPSPEGALAVRRLDAAVSALASRGVIDPHRVALTGFSRAGYQAFYILTHPGRTHLAAAIGDDFYFGSYEGQLVSASIGDVNDSGGAFAQEHASFWNDRHYWLEHETTFNVDRVRTPFMAVRSLNAGSPAYWPVQRPVLIGAFNANRRPLELLEFPEGDHPLTRPRERIALLNATVNWLLFWLTGEEDHDPANADLFRRWHELRDEWRQQQAWEAAGNPIGSKPSTAP